MSTNAVPLSSSHTNVVNHCPTLPHLTQMSTNTVPFSPSSPIAPSISPQSSHPPLHCQPAFSHPPLPASSTASPPSHAPSLAYSLISHKCRQSLSHSPSSHTNVDKRCPTLSLIPHCTVNQSAVPPSLILSTSILPSPTALSTSPASVPSPHHTHPALRTRPSPPPPQHPRA
jgi:hypothetical protein